MSPSAFEGSCLCGAVRFRVAAPSKWCAHCHCSLCRRAHGAGYVTWVGFEAGQLELTTGADALGRYHSSAEATRSFCRHCGSQLFFESSRWAGEIHVTRASIATDIDRAPQAHVFFSDRAPWIHVADELPRRGGSSGTEPLA